MTVSSTASDGTLDAVSITVLWDRLVSIADEATTTQVRAAFSTVVRESNDFAVSIMDRWGGTLASARLGLPSFIATQAVTLQHALEAFPADTLQEGDVIITNDPWIASAQLMDLTILSPIFRGGRVVAFGGSVAHSPDLGGTLRWARATDVFDDGLFIPLTKLFSAGEPNEELFRILRANCRQPERTLGDLEAQLSALRIINERVLALMAEYGLDDLDPVVEEIYGRCERVIRETLSSIPDGTYRSEVRLDNTLPSPITDAIERPDEPIMLHCALTISGSDITVDYTGSSQQLRNSANAIWPFTLAYTAYTLRVLLVPVLANNAGFMRPLRVISPPGTIVNANFPAPTNNRHVFGQQVVDVIFMAMMQAAPDRVMAPGGSSPNWLLFMTGRDRRGHTFSRLFPINGGLGGFPEKDGEIATFPANLGSTPIEMVETDQPVVVEAKEVIVDSAGPGRHRGAPGQRIVLRMQGETLYTMLTAKVENAPRGLLGGRDGRPGRLLLNGSSIHPGDGVLHEGDVLTIETPGGGGLHSPATRSIDRVVADVHEGLVSIGKAAAEYGVVMSEQTLEVDFSATEALRGRKA